MVGQKISHYKIIEKLGEGGMGVVYKAEDTQLRRIVALKFLPLHDLNEPDFKARLIREAQAAANLDHPNICGIYGIHEEDGQAFIAMTYIDGLSLADKIRQRPLPLGEALGIGIQIAEGLQEAHDKGIVHRDIKPHNVMLTRKGQVKVMDFGLASLTGRSKITKTGTRLGTLAYMAPEQLEGREVDRRADIWALGCVMYEMLAQRTPFDADHEQAIGYGIFNSDPEPVSAQRADVGPEIDRVIFKALSKDLERRYQHVDDLSTDLRRLGRETQDTQPRRSAPARRSRVALLPAALIPLALGFALAAWVIPRGGPQPSFRPFATEAVQETRPAWSPDGKAIAYLAEVQGVRQIFIRSLGSPSGVQVTKSRTDCGAPFWDPSNARVYYSSDHQLWSIGTAGGEPEVVNQDAEGGAISPDGKTFAIIRGREFGRLWLVSALDGTEQQYHQEPFPETIREAYVVAFSPDGSKISIAFNINSGGGYQFWVLPFPSGTPRRALPPSSKYRIVSGYSWMPDNRHIVIDADTPDVQGTHLYLIDTAGDEIIPITSGTGDESQPSIAPDGRTMAFLTGSTDYDLIESPLEGGPVRTLLGTSRMETIPQWSPAGSQYAYVTDANGTHEIWLRSLEDGWSRPLIAMGADGIPPWHGLQDIHFSRDGTRILYMALGSDHTIWISNIATARSVRLDLDSSDQHGPSWSPDDNWVSYFRLQAGEWEIAKAPVGGGKAVALTQTAFAYATVWSPSGDWIGFLNEKGLQLISPDGQSHKVLDDWGTAVCCSPFGFSKDGATVYSLRPGARSWEIVSIDVRTAERKRVFELAVPLNADLQGFSLNPNGKSFATAVGTTKHDVWLMEDFARIGGWWRFGGGQR